MALLDDIQAAVLEEGTDLGPILLKVRLLAARLGSQPLADWVKHESEGYPPDSPLPDYRIIPVSYTGTFSGPFGSGIKNAPIPPTGPALFHTFAFLLDEVGGVFKTRDEEEQIEDWIEVDASALSDVADRLDTIPSAPSKDIGGDWADWGHFRAIVHRVVAEELSP